MRETRGPESKRYKDESRSHTGEKMLHSWLPAWRKEPENVGSLQKQGQRGDTSASTLILAQ